MKYSWLWNNAGARGTDTPAVENSHITFDPPKLNYSSPTVDQKPYDNMNS